MKIAEFSRDDIDNALVKRGAIEIHHNISNGQMDRYQVIARAAQADTLRQVVREFNKRLLRLPEEMSVPEFCKEIATFHGELQSALSEMENEAK